MELRVGFRNRLREGLEFTKTFAVRPKNETPGGIPNGHIACRHWRPYAGEGGGGGGHSLIENLKEC